MSLYDRLIHSIEEKKLNREQGNFNCIPLPFPRYREYLEGFSKGDYIGLMGYTGSGKSRLVRYFMYQMVDFAMANKYPLKVLYFSLEDPEIPVGLKVISHYLYVRHGMSISAKALMSRETALENRIVQVIKADELFWRKFYTHVEVINGLCTPNQIQNKVREVYAENSKDTHIVVIIDNQSNICADPEDDSDWAAIKRLSRSIVRLGFCKAGITTIQVLQIDADTEKNTFRNAGKGSLINIEPNLSSIADAKIVSRSMHFIWGLFIPWRFELERYPSHTGYDISVLRNTFASLIHLKSNEGEIAPRFGLRFDGLHEVFSEMPMIDDKDALNKIYQEVLLKQRNKLEKRALFQK